MSLKFPYNIMSFYDVDCMITNLGANFTAGGALRRPFLYAKNVGLSPRL
jgi:hypothetical protein